VLGLGEGVAEAHIDGDRDARTIEHSDSLEPDAAVDVVFANGRSRQLLNIEHQTIFAVDGHDVGEDFAQAFFVQFAKAEEVCIARGAMIIAGPDCHEHAALEHELIAMPRLYDPLNREEASLFFRLVSYRYGRGAMMITTNKSIRDWTELLAGDEVLATAILDRLLHRAHVLNIKGRSYRLRDLEDALKA
jgi:hypothetical protein